MQDLITVKTVMKNGIHKLLNINRRLITLSTKRNPYRWALKEIKIQTIYPITPFKPVIDKLFKYNRYYNYFMLYTAVCLSQTDVYRSVGFAINLDLSNLKPRYCPHHKWRAPDWLLSPAIHLYGVRHDATKVC
ncbi:hypothetical protein D3C85_1256410 [compost metagenome]